MTGTLADQVRVGRRFTRAVRVDADLHDASALDGYICSQSAVETLLLMARHVVGSGHGAFTWTGPYGSGKSSLAVLLGAMLTRPAHALPSLLAAADADDRAELLTAFRKSDAPWLLVPVVGSRSDVEQSVRTAIAAVVGRERSLAIRSNETIASWAQRVSHSDRYQGVAFLIDEMGKFLEDAARNAGDVHLFQDLAEHAARANGRMLVVGILHQAFDEYAHRLAREARDEWIKVQGRFIDLPVNLAGDEQLELIGRAIESDRKPGTPETIDVATAVALRPQRPQEQNALADRLVRTWPLHPVVAALLGPISKRRFGQNQRSLFGFLNSVEPSGFQEYLIEAPAADGRFPVARLWDYLHANLEPAILASPDGHRWSTALEALGRTEAKGASDAHIALLKAIALIDLFKDRSGLQPTPELIDAIAADARWPAAEPLLRDLVDWSVVVYRKHVGSFAIYAGSDFDIEGAVDAARQQGIGIDFRKLARQATLQPVLAKRHYEETGALRWFEIELAPLHELEDRVRSYKPAAGAAGLILLAISGNSESPAQARRTLRQVSQLVGNHLIVLGWSRDSYMIREMAADLAALEHVRATRPELEGDAIARREVDARLARLSADLEDRLGDALHGVDWLLPPGAEHLAHNDIHGPAALSVLASRLAKWRYPSAPRLPNELVNRTRPSSNAMAATRALLRAMVENAKLPRLGIAGYPPEAGLYIGLLSATGLHDGGEDGSYRFVAPADGDAARLFPLWEKTDAVLADRCDSMSLNSIYDLWRAPPFGVRDGLLPILAIAYVLSRQGRCAIYLDRSFRPQLDSFLVDRMLQDPECVAVRYVELNDADRSLVSGLAAGLAETDQPVEPVPLAVARALVKAVRDLPGWTLRTNSLDAIATQLRDRLKTADDPNRLIVSEIPAVLGLDLASAAGTDVAEAIVAAIARLRGAYPNMLKELQDGLLKELRVRGRGDASFEMLRRRAQTVRSLTGNFRLDALATRLSNYGGSLEELEGLASLAANKPARDWVDRDLDAARIELAALAQQFLKAEGFARLKGRPDGRIAMAVYISDPAFAEPTACEVELSREEQAEAIALADRIAAQLTRDGVAPDIMIAALATLGLRLTQVDLNDVQRVHA